ncbi:Hypothetical protein AA314_00920 [Archangium gephyra]|uniref:Uncharacterized protein n=1 Tax=Archangium gephyra TaxID=48 RepID=A0AAC8Q1M1_9BACT|nr:Hypothetical protein AA314_00920 [Archangium gephyra]
MRGQSSNGPFGGRHGGFSVASNLRTGGPDGNPIKTDVLFDFPPF